MSDTNDAVELAPAGAAPREDEVVQVETAEEEETRGLVTGLRRSNRRLKNVLIGTLAVVCLVGASLGVYFGAFHNKGDGMSVRSQTDTEFDASFTHDQTTINVLLHNTPVGEPNVVEWTFDFEGAGRRVEYSFDMENNVLVLDGHGTVLTAHEKAALAALQGELARWVVSAARDQQATLNVGLIERAAAYLSVAPHGHVIQTRTFELTPGQGRVAPDAGHTSPEDEPAQDAGRAKIAAWEGDDGTTCLTWGGIHQARYDGYSGDWSWWRRVGTDSSCTGRCGAGCNWFDREAFQDCLDHDVCLDHFGGSVLFDNSNCGDEFNHAADDYIVSYGWFC